MLLLYNPRTTWLTSKNAVEFGRTFSDLEDTDISVLRLNVGEANAYLCVELYNFGLTVKRDLVFYIDVDDTIIRPYGNKRIPIISVIEHLQQLVSDGATLYCWSSGGADYAQSVAKELEIESLFLGFLPKPHVVIDDVAVSDWTYLVQVHPNQCVSKDLDDYRYDLSNVRKTNTCSE